MNGKNAEKLPRTTDEELEEAIKRIHDAANGYPDLDVRSATVEMTLAYEREQDAKRKAERKNFRIPQSFINSIWVVAALLILYFVLR